MKKITGSKVNLLVKSTKICESTTRRMQPIEQNNMTNKISDKEEYVSTIERLIDKEVCQCANQINVDREELQAWVNVQMGASKNIPRSSILSLLRIAKEHLLNPILNEVFLVQHEDSYQIMISLDGWIKLINNHYAFSGISFNQSPEEVDGLPTWMECTITRSDRTSPITIREYLVEVKNDSDYWRKIPRRMLRHKTMQQCARLALGITISDKYFEKMSDNASTSAEESKLRLPPNIEKSQAEKLKTLLNTGGKQAMIT